MIPQYVYCKAFDSSGPVTGDAANITARVAIDDGDLDDVVNNVAEERGNGVYRFALSDTERTGIDYVFDFSSSTPGVNVLLMPKIADDPSAEEIREEIDNNSSQLAAIRGSSDFPPSAISATWNAAASQISKSIGGCFWSTRDPAKMLTTGDVEASVGDVVEKWVSVDGSVTLDAVGSPVLVQRHGQTFPSIHLDGTSGFTIDFGASSTPLVASIDAGVMVAGFMRTGGPSANVNILLSSNPSNTTGARLSLGTGMISGARSSGIAVLQSGTGNLRTYTEGAMCGRTNHFSRVIMSSDGVAYECRTQFGVASLLGSSDGLWLDASGGFDPRILTIGFLRNSAGDSAFFEGDISYAGYLDSTADADAIEDELEAAYPTRASLMLGDSRFNSDDLFAALDESAGGISFREVATGSYTPEQCETDFVSDVDAGHEYSDVVVLCGANVTIAAGTAGAAQSQIRGLLDTIRTRLSNARIHICNETPFAGNGSANAAEVEAHRVLSAAIESEARRRDGVYLVDSFGAMEDPESPDHLRGSDTIDGLHFSEAGYSRLVQAIIPAIKSSSLSGDSISDVVSSVAPQVRIELSPELARIGDLATEANATANKDEIITESIDVATYGPLISSVATLLSELTEDDGSGSNRFTEKSLESAPGGAGSIDTQPIIDGVLDGLSSGVTADVVKVNGVAVSSVTDFHAKNLLYVGGPQSPTSTIQKAFYEIPAHTTGDTWPGLLDIAVVYNDGSTVDLTGATIKMQVRASENSPDVLEEFSTADATITIDSAEDGVFSIPAADLSLTPGLYVYDIELVLESGVKRTFLYGTWRIVLGVTQ